MTTATRPPTLHIRPGNERFTTAIGWLHSRHSFSFGRHYDPANVGYRSLRVINDDIVAPRGGFGEHGHDNMEILTWVLSGAVRHGDSLGHSQRLGPGELQRMTAGSGIRHSEYNDSVKEPVHFLQIWIEPDRENLAPAYDQRAFDAAGRSNQWQTLASGHEADVAAGAMSIRQNAIVRVADVAETHTVTVDNGVGRHAYVHVATGTVRVGDTTLQAGDAFTLDEPGRVDLQATESAQIFWFDLA